MRTDQICFLFKKADELFVGIEERYNQAIEIRDTSNNDLKIDILYHLVTLRVVLDYLAQDIGEFFSLTAKRFYFPITIDPVEFEKVKFVKEIKSVDTKIYEYLFNIQPFPAHKEARGWLAEMNDLVNHNKHDSLTPHTATERDCVMIGKMTASSIYVGDGGRIVDENGEDLVHGAAMITPENVEDLKASGKISKDFKSSKWTSISFDSMDKPVTSFLLESRRSTASICIDVYKVLGVDVTGRRF